ncbi:MULTISPECIES: hypothetical protein [unclassified Roseovarius]|uniref:hypothetical protein n=1 Tax=unclassified Roseovarius TaxID=2614913 RepID=UPI00273F8EB2|nr:hypothetical protein [Roseovarius sp. MMSF_3350]
MNITGPAPVTFLPAVPAGAGQNLQKLAVRSASGSAESSASGNNSDNATGEDGPRPEATVRSARDEVSRLPAKASGESVLDARIKSQETPRDQLVAAQYELVGRQQDLLRASTRQEQSRAVRDITDLREMIEVLKVEVRGDRPPGRAGAPAVDGGA